MIFDLIIYICFVTVVPRHQGRIAFLEYIGEGTVEKTLYLVGKVSWILLVIYLTISLL